MYSPKPSDPAVQELGGDLLEGSGFETEDPATVRELDERSAEEDVLQ
jgi:hypothetical protein